MASASDNDFYLSDLVKGTFAYHTTNVLLGSPQPDFKELKWHLAADKFYDGLLVGFPGAFFSTTLKKNGTLPRSSPYPTSGTPGEEYWRLRIPLKFFDKYDTIWLTKDNVTQKQLILATEEESKYFEDVCGVKSLDLNDNPYLFKRGNSWFVNTYDPFDDSKKKFFVNFLIFGDFPLEFCENDCSDGCEDHCQYDSVVKTEMGPGKLKTPSSYLNCSDTCSENCKLHWKGANETESEENEKFREFCRNHSDRNGLAEEARKQWHKKQTKRTS